MLVECFRSLIHAYELTLDLHVFRETKPLRRVDCLAPPPVCVKDGGIPFSALPKDTTSKLDGLLSTLSLCAERKRGSCEYHFFSLCITRLWEYTPGLPTAKRTFQLLRHHADLRFRCPHVVIIFYSFVT